MSSVSINILWLIWLIQYKQQHYYSIAVCEEHGIVPIHYSNTLLLESIFSYKIVEKC
jgi:hypothetical protein